MLRRMRFECVCSYLALGLDPERAAIFLQSDVPLVTDPLDEDDETLFLTLSNPVQAPILETRSRELAAPARRPGHAILSKEKYESNALTEQAYINNEKKFEKVDLDDLKKLNPKLDIVHLIVDTTKDQPEDWYIIGAEKR